MAIQGPLAIQLAPAEYPRYARFIQLAPAEGYSGTFGPFSLLATGQKKYPCYAWFIQLAPVESYSEAFGPLILLQRAYQEPSAPSVF